VTSNLGSRERVLACYADGVSAIASAGGRVSDWETPTPCGRWTILELAGHLLAIVNYYHRLLEASAAGSPIGGLPRGDDLAAMNACDLSGLTVSDGEERITRFCELAERYRTRLEETDWNSLLGVWAGLGELTVGQHTGVAVGEWNVHAWDLARATGTEHRPEDPILIANGQGVIGRVVDLEGSEDPWIAVLVAYGRDPHWGLGTDR
jgi:uncharacterized protein (TIGR03083 family)